MPPRKKEYICLECKQKVADNQYSVCCSICDRWLHKDCGLDDDEYKLIDKMFQKKGYHCWSCDGCAHGLVKLHKMIAANQMEIASIKETVSEVQATTDQNTKDIANNADNIVTMNKDIEDLKNKESCISSTDDVFEEMDLRESKKANLMIFSLPESEQSLPSLQKKENDIKVVKNICSYLGVDFNYETDVKFIYRVGVVGEKPRPLSLGLRYANQRDDILKRAWRLGKNSKYDKISLAPDLTPLQVKKEKKLQAEAQENNENLTGNDAKNFVWKLIGTRGNRILRKVKIKEQAQPRTRIGSVRTRAEMEEGEVIEEEEGGARLNTKQRRY